LLAPKATILFLIGNRRLLLSRIPHILEDFLEDKFNVLSLAELNELERIKTRPDKIEKSYLFSQLKYYALPFYSRD
jgi:hypothetical protein